MAEDSSQNIVKRWRKTQFRRSLQGDGRFKEIGKYDQCVLEDLADGLGASGIVGGGVFVHVECFGHLQLKGMNRLIGAAKVAGDVAAFEGVVVRESVGAVGEVCLGEIDQGGCCSFSILVTEDQIGEGLWADGGDVSADGMGIPQQDARELLPKLCEQEADLLVVRLKVADLSILDGVLIGGGAEIEGLISKRARGNKLCDHAAIVVKRLAFGVAVDIDHIAAVASIK